MSSPSRQTSLASPSRLKLLSAGAAMSRHPVDPRIVQALATIRGDYGQCLLVSQLAARAGLSRSRFEHLFKDETGVTFKSRLRSLRLKRAQ